MPQAWRLCVVLGWLASLAWQSRCLHLSMLSIDWQWLLQDGHLWGAFITHVAKNMQFCYSMTTWERLTTPIPWMKLRWILEMPFGSPLPGIKQWVPEQAFKGVLKSACWLIKKSNAHMSPLLSFLDNYKDCMSPECTLSIQPSSPSWLWYCTNLSRLNLLGEINVVWYIPWPTEINKKTWPDFAACDEEHGK